MKSDFEQLVVALSICYQNVAESERRDACLRDQEADALVAAFVGVRVEPQHQLSLDFRVFGCEVGYVVGKFHDNNVLCPHLDDLCR
jgi:hypothetical protein